MSAYVFVCVGCVCFKEVLGDDSKTEAIGHLVRGPFCSAVAALITDGMKRFRMGGLVRNNLWHVVQASVAKSGVLLSVCLSMRSVCLSVKGILFNRTKYVQMEAKSSTTQCPHQSN